MSFHSIKPAQLGENLFDLIGKDWFLMSAEKEGRVNPMTVAWATMGILWQKPVVMCAVRPERFTREFLDASDVFSLTVFDKSWKKMLGYCGTVSGRDEDKVQKSGLTVVHEDGVPYFEENRMAFLCHKLCVTPLAEQDFLGNTTFTGKWYGGENNADGTGGGYHLLYIAEITNILVKD